MEKRVNNSLKLLEAPYTFPLSQKKKFSSKWNNMMYNLWKNHEISNDIDSKRSLSRRFKVIICIIDQRASWTLLATSVFPFR